MGLTNNDGILGATSLTSWAGTYTTGGSAQLLPSNSSRQALMVQLDGQAGASTCYFLLGSGICSSSNFHFCLQAGGSWDGVISSVLWQGPIQCYSSATPALKIGVCEL